MMTIIGTVDDAALANDLVQTPTPCNFREMLDKYKWAGGVTTRELSFVLMSGLAATTNTTSGSVKSSMHSCEFQDMVR
jgi:hypothetical protein